MVTRRALLRSTAAVGGGLLVGACAPGAAPAAAPAATRRPTAKVTLRLSHSHPEGDTALHVFATKLKELAAAKSDGQIDIQIFANNVLGQEREIVQQVQQGLVDIMASGTAIWGNLAPKLQILDLPFLFRDHKHIDGTMDGEVGQLLSRHTEEVGKGRPLAYFDSFGFRNVVTRSREVKSVDDLKGLKLRTIQSPIYVKAIELMGASPTPMAFGEVYTSLQTGVIDGYEHDASTTIQAKLHEVTKYVAKTAHISGVLVAVASPQRVDALAPEVRKRLQDAVTEAAAYQRGRAPAEDEKALAQLQQFGLKVNEVDRTVLASRASEFWSSYAKSVGAEDVVKKIRP